MHHEQNHTRGESYSSLHAPPQCEAVASELAERIMEEQPESHLNSAAIVTAIAQSIWHSLPIVDKLTRDTALLTARIGRPTPLPSWRLASISLTVGPGYILTFTFTFELLSSIRHTVESVMTTLKAFTLLAALAMESSGSVPVPHSYISTVHPKSQTFEVSRNYGEVWSGWFPARFPSFKVVGECLKNYTDLKTLEKALNIRVAAMKELTAALDRHPVENALVKVLQPPTFKRSKAYRLA
ncbi:hypothetical protein B0H13DRAFT_2310310 [Mycena leptocephala]|nr:hypothetical protein B0H13DRAFT_2310310 [Mycena leptocephala]